MELGIDRSQQWRRKIICFLQKFKIKLNLQTTYLFNAMVKLDFVTRSNDKSYIQYRKVNNKLFQNSSVPCFGTKFNKTNIDIQN